MDVYSWFRRSPSSANGQITKQEPQQDKAEEELFGVTDQLIDFIKTFTVETFKNFPLQGTFNPLKLRYNFQCILLTFYVTAFR